MPCATPRLPPLVLGKLPRPEASFRVGGLRDLRLRSSQRQYVREIEPGEMVRISKAASSPFASRPKSSSAVHFRACLFLRPDSIIFGRSSTKAARCSDASWRRSIRSKRTSLFPSGFRRSAAVGYALE